MAGERQYIEFEYTKKVYFASDQHFGAPDETSSLLREKHFVKWLDKIKSDATALFLLGDLFDFWFEYKQVVPRGFVRVLGKLAELRDANIPIFFFTGNHDMWMKDYFEKELDIPVFHQPHLFHINNQSFLIAHGDGLGPGDKGYKRLKKLFKNPVAKFMFYLLHPDFAVWLGKRMSLNNKLISGDEDVNFKGKEEEWLFQYAQKKLEESHIDNFIFGHRHLPIELDLNEKSKYINLGDWVNYFTYAVFDGENLKLESYPIK